MNVSRNKQFKMDIALIRAIAGIKAKVNEGSDVAGGWGPPRVCRYIPSSFSDRAIHPVIVAAADVVDGGRGRRPVIRRGVAELSHSFRPSVTVASDVR